MIFVDGVDIGDPADVALRDRRMLSADGIFIVVATVSEQSGRPVADTEVIFRGVPFVEQADELVADIREEVTKTLERAAADGLREIDLLSQELHDDLGGARLRPAAPPADGAAGRRRGLSLERARRFGARRAGLRDTPSGGQRDDEPGAPPGRIGLHRDRPAVAWR